MVKMFRRSNGKLYLEYEAYGKIVQKSTRLEDTPQNRALVKKEVIPALQGKILRGELSQEKPKKFSYYSELFLREKTHLKTYKRVQMHVASINAFFGDILIDQIKRSDIKDWVNDMLFTRSPKTVRNYMSSLRGVIDIAIDKEHVTHNVAHNIKLPPHTPAEVEPFTEEEVKLVINSAKSEFLKLYLAVGFYTGLRTGEILGIMHGDIDFENKVINIKRSISDGKITTPKTQKSIRQVPLLDDLVPYLKKPTKSLWLFSKDTGANLGRFGENRYREWRALLKACNLAYRKPYVTRHTFIVTMLKNSDLSIMQIAQMTGHTTTQMIIQNYAKYIKGEHLKVDRDLKLFTDKSADSTA